MALLSHNEEYVWKAGADTLAELSKQGEIQIFLAWTKYIDMLVADSQESIRPAIPQITALLSNSNVCAAGAYVLSKLSDQGKISNLLT